jgi:hypothetical protein
MKNKLVSKYHDFLRYWDDPMNECKGTCILEGRVFNLITKRNYWNKPTYDTLINSLLYMKILVINNHIKKIAMPIIGCGLDKLQWNKVSQIIQATFEDLDIEILVCKQ